MAHAHAPSMQVSLTLVGSQVNDNSARPTLDGAGGALYIDARSTGNVTGLKLLNGSTMRNNRAGSGGGGAVHVIGSVTGLLVSNNSRIDGNIAASSGGAIYASGSIAGDPSRSMLLKCRYAGNSCRHARCRLHVCAM